MSMTEAEIKKTLVEELSKFGASMSSNYVFLVRNKELTVEDVKILFRQHAGIRIGLTYCGKSPNTGRDIYTWSKRKIHG